ncbi:uncharacterized protein L3040_007941 [Drepanopeziza brunnea f. sp. 'multigermtubi']|uniref:Uncharacterized protein n=1 Tax=Marssonina brunnea f. sp. multigermtubi (strain MB_m1) TaxID=1072389 RepID=K1WMH3_MARBU|nr:uncharacterized protein MBM_07733 [Drepanopeziza brunnea f. sp. 'multigermtubi' MB_m1]EKD14056.1 hypothetical protein MBM_07733 [Drepanopeziza brunnea f. sp. 'multigermtubi' MB_m1]KAJ5035474.1 hypothetical protein L3040_007941 [Drepanopeziza brunnea f. sp. 'multigermtubi']
MPSQSSASHHHQQAQKQSYYLTTSDEKSSDQSSQEYWKEPYTIDDADLMFDGKPLNLLYEENRYQAEHHYVAFSETSRGRSRQSKK